MSAPTRDALSFPESKSSQIDPYITSTIPSSLSTSSRLFVTLTFATSLDSNLSLSPGVQTALSGPESKAMTHYLRSKHDAILIGVGTAVADNPSLNCRIEGVGGYGGSGLEGQPRPIVLDPSGRWDFNEGSKVLKLAKEGRGKAPWLVTREEIRMEKRKILESVGGKVFTIPNSSTSRPHIDSRFQWPIILDFLDQEGITSVMIEGGGAIINDLLSPQYSALVDSVIITIAPTWLGKGGVQVCPGERVEEGKKLPVGRLQDVKWIPLGDDVVLCGRPKPAQ